MIRRGEKCGKRRIMANSELEKTTTQNRSSANELREQYEQEAACCAGTRKLTCANTWVRKRSKTSAKRKAIGSATNQGEGHADRSLKRGIRGSQPLVSLAKLPIFCCKSQNNLKRNYGERNAWVAAWLNFRSAMLLRKIQIWKESHTTDLNVDQTRYIIPFLF